jgi:hypothetical protein
VSLADGDLFYIKNDGDGGEELFNRHDDPRELTNLASRPGMAAELERLRKEVVRLRAATSTVGR